MSSPLGCFPRIVLSTMCELSGVRFFHAYMYISALCLSQSYVYGYQCYEWQVRFSLDDDDEVDFVAMMNDDNMM
jgi:hypothetical protein